VGAPGDTPRLQGLYEALFEHSVDGVLLGTPDGTVIRANPSACRMLGCSEADVLRIGRTGFLVDAPEARRLLETRRDRGAVSGVVLFRRLDGTTFPAEATSTIVPGPSGEAITCTTFRDVTERIRAEETLAASEELFRVAFDDASVGKALMAPDGHPLRVNQALCGMMGYRAEELLSLNWRDITHPDDREATAREIERAARSPGGIGRLEKRYFRKDGSVLWCDTTTRAVRGPGGAVSHFITSLIDVTARKQAEEERRASHALFRTLAKEAPVGIFQADVYGHITYANPAAVRIAGLEPGQAGLVEWKESIHPEDRERVVQEWYGAVSAGRVYLNQLRFQLPDGSVTWVRVSGTAIRDGAGIVTGYIGVVEDITQSLELQAQVALNSRLAALGTLLAGVAHEINNPLAGALGAKTLAIEDLEGIGLLLRRDPLDRSAVARQLEQTVEILRRSQDEVQRIAAIVQDLNHFGQPSRERAQIRLEDRLKGVLEAVQESLQRSVTVRVEGGDAPPVLGSPAQLDQVLTALVTSAARPLPDRPDRVVTVRLGEGPAGMARIEVTDDGPGLRPEQLDRVFEPFFETGKDGPGRARGLSLPVAHAIVIAHGGTLTATSTPGQGSTFRVELPAAPAQPSRL
jgi:two-component system NtrC family sensor kinase